MTTPVASVAEGVRPDCRAESSAPRANASGAARMRRCIGSPRGPRASATTPAEPRGLPCRPLWFGARSQRESQVPGTWSRTAVRKIHTGSGLDQGPRRAFARSLSESGSHIHCSIAGSKCSPRPARRAYPQRFTRPHVRCAASALTIDCLRPPALSREAYACSAGPGLGAPCRPLWSCPFQDPPGTRPAQGDRGAFGAEGHDSDRDAAGTT